MGGFSSWASIFGGSTVAQVQQSRDQRKLQKQALNEQKALQEKALSAANKQARLNEAELAKANQKQPDMLELLTGAQRAGNAGPSTMLTGSKGLDPLKMKLQRPSLLGE